MATYPLQVLERSGRYFLVNTSDRAIRHLVYSAGASFIDWDGGTLIDPAVLHAQLDDIPPGGHVPVNASVPDGEEIVWWRADEVVWDDGRRDEAIELARREPLEAEVAWP